MRCVIVDNNVELAASIAALLRAQGLDVLACAPSAAVECEMIGSH